jgi:hypothetical protein
MDMSNYKKFIEEIASLKILNQEADIDDVARMMQELGFFQLGKDVIIVHGEVRVL